MRLTPRNRPRPGSDDHLIPLINVVFLMLIFFMVAGSIVAPTPFPVTPPTATAAPKGDAAGPALVLAADGRLALDGIVIAPDQLAVRLAASPTAGNAAVDGPSPVAAAAPTLVLKADAGVPMALLRETLARLRAAGVERVSLLTVRAP